MRESRLLERFRRSGRSPLVSAGSPPLTSPRTPVFVCSRLVSVCCPAWSAPRPVSLPLTLQASDARSSERSSPPSLGTLSSSAPSHRNLFALSPPPCPAHSATCPSLPSTPPRRPLPSALTRALSPLISPPRRTRAAQRCELTREESGAACSQAIKTDSLVFLSGCIPLVPETMKVVEGGIEEQTVRLRCCRGGRSSGESVVWL